MLEEQVENLQPSAEETNAHPIKTKYLEFARAHCAGTEPVSGSDATSTA
jgi:hypothetical protein